ncbi:MAG: PAS domain S-box protein [Anaerolineaceae bacterium]|nr:PAS domain S-box protein [Anaerolineaceae bacterium]
MSERRRFFYLFVIMTGIASIVAAISITVLYFTALNQEKERLMEIAESHARLIESITDHGIEAGNSVEYIMDIILDAYDDYPGFSLTGEFTIARKEGEKIIFLTGMHQENDRVPEPVLWSSDLAEPQKRALSGESGIMVGLDYSGEKVLAAYEQVAYFELGIVAKIDMVEVQKPFINAIGFSLLLAIFVVLIGIVGFRRISGQVLESFDEAITEKEEKYHQLFESMLNGFALHEIVCDQEGEPIDYRFLEINPAFEALTGLNAADLIGRTVLEVMPDTEEYWIKSYGTVALSGQSLNYENYSQVLNKYYEITAYCPKPGFFATIFTDVTERKLASELIKKKNKEMGNYLYAASHDLRTPLVNVQGFSQRLETQLSELFSMLESSSNISVIKDKINALIQKEMPKSLGFILNNVSKMDVLLSGLLQISRTGRQNMAIHEVDMVTLIDGVIASHAYQIEELNALIVVDELPVCFGDKRLLDQLFSNLISNALKYKDKNKPLKIQITANCQQNIVEYCVRDTGKGISGKNIEKIWEVFYQVDPRIINPGDGIGLNIVKTIVEKHNGKIWVESQVGEGSAFYVQLPNKVFVPEY